jgi:nucleoside-diphosphate-sugar epimerase
MTALVTGAAGFIGGRLVEILTDRGHRVQALVRDRRAALERADQVRYFVGDVTQPDSLRPAVTGCSVVFHCAHGEGDLANARRINVQGTLNVVDASAEAGVRRVVHVSSWRVHGRSLPAHVHEDLPLVRSGNPYDVSKAEAEEAATALARRRGVEFVILRPTLVYGPGCEPWVNTLVRRLKHEQLYLIDGGRGLANVVHVDDLIEAMLLSAVRADAPNRRFIISGAAPVLWREYIGGLAKLVRKPLPRSIPLWAAPLVVNAYLWRLRFTRRTPRLVRQDLGLFGEYCAASIDRARRILGYEPRVDLAAGMQSVERYLRRIGILPAVAPRATAAPNSQLMTMAASNCLLADNQRDEPPACEHRLSGVG